MDMNGYERIWMGMDSIHEQLLRDTLLVKMIGSPVFIATLTWLNQENMGILVGITFW